MATQQWNWSFTPTRATPAKDLPSNTDWKRVIPTSKVFTNYKVQNLKIRQVWVGPGRPGRSGRTGPLHHRGLSQITFALRVGRWSEKRVVYHIKSAN